MNLKNVVPALAATFALAGALMAQPGPGAGPRRGGNATPPSASDMVERRVEMLTKRLELTSAQQTQAKAIFTEEATAMTALQPKMQEARQAFEDAVKTTGLDLDIERAAAASGALHTQMMTIQGKAQAKLRAILTPAQKEKLDAQRGPGGMGGGMGRGMGPGRMMGGPR